MNSDGSNPIDLTNNPAPDSQLTWAPDGSKIAFLSQRDGSDEIWVMNAEHSFAVFDTPHGTLSHQLAILVTYAVGINIPNLFGVGEFDRGRLPPR